ncbi:glyoxylase [Aspergillus sclerotioniger CBS 115572]|uniref:hydroxyacylglutathione hydrolase n=1 Tax=Aspergillus sclerotioniger CBS 115572 TaxID=1450535 RepID=A0A317XBF2_9EURO|nr:glyoxylase [Aspergillus sclerotioniger CBS 115572]PWY94288.1 glyoxylase [Aspergillus sclerotioniger CBS 115572]
MAKVIFTPWKEHSSLLAVRGQFYPAPFYDGPDMRSKACATVGAWKLRGNLPHPVEATALLTDAILHDDAQKNSIFSIRATYSAAFCRFVTGLVDSKLNGQRKTMFQRAIDLGLPASFVELRHEATHRELPSLTVLRNATQRSLEWLWDYYWAKTDLSADMVPGVSEPGMFDGADDDVEPIKAAARDSLEQLLVEEESSEPPRKKRRFQQNVSFASTHLVSICKSSSYGASTLANVIVEDSILVPAGRKIGDSMTETFSKWDPLLQMLAEGHAPVLAALAEELVNVLAFSDSRNLKNDPHLEGTYMWLDHILRSPEWESRGRLLSHAYILAVCEQSSNHWTALLGETIQEKSGQTAGKVSASSQSKTESGLKRTEDAEDLKELKKFGWETVDTWDTRPLGIQVQHSQTLMSMCLTRAVWSSVRFQPVRARVPAPARQIRAMHVQSIPIITPRYLFSSSLLTPPGTGKGNNYAYLVTDEPTKQSVIIDPANPPEVAPKLQPKIDAGEITLTAIVSTHHHWDHAGGNNEMLKTFGQLPVIGGKDCQAVTKTPAHGEVFKIGERISVKALHTPCHTQDSICYFMQDGDEKVVFTGDTLFIGGCGRFFEGTAPEMHKALNETLAALPDDTKVYPGHEYTKGNVQFCLAVSQSEPIKKLEAFANENKETQGKFTIGDEKLHNVFMRVNDPEIQKKTGKTDPVEVMAALREMKNSM